MPIDFIGAFTKIEWSRLSRILQNQNRFRTHSMGQKMLYMLERKTPGTWVTVLFCHLLVAVLAKPLQLDPHSVCIP